MARRHSLTRQGLYQCMDAASEVEDLEERIARLRAKLTSTTGGAGPGGSGVNTDKIINGIASLERLETSLRRKLGTYGKRAARIERDIDILDDPEQRKVIRLRYYDALEWEEIGEKMGCSRRTAIRIHKKALERLGLTVRQS